MGDDRQALRLSTCSLGRCSRRKNRSLQGKPAGTNCCVFNHSGQFAARICFVIIQKSASIDVAAEELELG